MSQTQPTVLTIESKNLILDLAPVPMWIYDLDTYAFLAVNQEAVRHYGFSESEFLQMTIKDIRSAEDVPIVEKAVKATRVRQSTFKDNGLFRHQKKDGSVIHVHIKSNLISYQGKNAEIVTAIDLTERFIQEKKVEEQKQFLAIIGSINAIFLKSESWSLALEECLKTLGDFLGVNRICFYDELKSNLLGYPKVSWCTSDYTSSSSDSSTQELLFSEFPHFMESIQAGDSVQIKVSDLPASQAKDLLKSQNIKNILGLPLIINQELVGILNIEDSKKDRIWQENETQVLQTLVSNLAHVVNQAQILQILADNEAKFRSLVQNGNDLIAIIDSEGNYNYVAPTSMKVLGIPPEEFIGKNAFQYIHKDDVERILKNLEQMETQKSVSVAPYRFQDAAKNWRWIQTDLTNHLSDPVIAGIVANTREVTVEVEKRMAEQLLSSLTKAIGQPGSLAACLSDAMNKLAEGCDFTLAEMWWVSEDKSRLDLFAISENVDLLEQFFQESHHIHSFKKREGLPGMVWEHKKIQIMEDLCTNPLFLRNRAIRGAKLNTAIGFPVLYNEEFLGCIVCFSPRSKKELLPQVKLLSELGVQLGAVMKQKMTEEQYHNFFNISPDPHGLLGFDGYLKKVNNAFVKVLGYDKRELLSKPVFQFLLEDEIPRANKRLKELIKGAATNSFEAKFLTKEGKVKWLVWKGTVIKESKIIIAVAKDITEQKEVEIKLSASNEKLRRAQKIAKLGYWYRDFTTDVTEWSEETYQIYGYEPDSFIPSMENVKLSFHPDDRHLLEADPNEHLEPDQVRSFEHRIITATNKIKWVHQEIRMLMDENDLPYRIEGTIQDITERKENELQLAISNERFQLAIKASNEMIWEIDHQKQTIYRGAGYSRLVNYKANEPFTRRNSWCRNLPSSEMDRIWTSLLKALADKNETFWSAEYMVNTEEGGIAYFVDRCFILRDEKGRPLRSVGSVLDVTASRQQLERIKDQNQKLREIAWLQSHVIRAPLTRIMSLIYLLKEHEGGGKSLDEIIDLISASAEELDQVILDIVNKTEAVKEDDKTDITN
ncbi:PAS domain-containing protein [Algoriphagus sp. AGSA1]|uniref:PAS domain-containing protein n=1 Tax=Algoriphagus sp. AGSA1 TaxID=2907213 RepID=UPI001F3D63D4|nr:PAS domain-containing protein [Algoriphagus sp. AGSA1]MCE7056096.1 PAS domain-containing protein [Algoriphagus sp. AGSA1]